MNRLLSFFFVISSFALVQPSAHCNSYREASFDKKAINSDLVFVGRVRSTTKNCMPLTSCATVEIMTSLKGKYINNVVVLYGGAISEMQPLCCEVGHTYLFFLEEVRDTYFQSVDGPFGIYVLSGIDKKNIGAGIGAGVKSNIQTGAEPKN